MKYLVTCFCNFSKYSLDRHSWGKKEMKYRYKGHKPKVDWWEFLILYGVVVWCICVILLVGGLFLGG